MRPFLPLLLALSIASVQAGETNATTQVSLQVASSCEIDSTSDINFGEYDPVGVHAQLPSYASGTVSVRCSKGTSNVSVGILQGSSPLQGSSCDAPARAMLSSKGQQLYYHIYRDAARTQPWGCGQANRMVLPTFQSSLQPISVTTYGALPPAQDAQLGTYRDTVEVQVSF